MTLSNPLSIFHIPNSQNKMDVNNTKNSWILLFKLKSIAMKTIYPKNIINAVIYPVIV